MRLVFFGSGAFGLPTLRRLVEHHDVALVVSQPDRPAGRRRTLTPTPVAAWSLERGLALERPENANDPAVIRRIHDAGADAFVVIAFGQKLGPALLGGTFAINLHGSLLPKYRGAAPINWAIINGEADSGVTVITLAQRMDAGTMLARASTPIGPAETAGELHDRLAELGPDLVARTLDEFAAGTLAPEVQDEHGATRAPKLGRADARVDLTRAAATVARRINGLTPWPGCDVRLDDEPLRLCRAEMIDASGAFGAPGTLLEDGAVACGEGRVRLLEVQAPGRRIMTFDDYRRGRGCAAGARITSP